MENIQQRRKKLKFDWDTRWLCAAEYEHILKNIPLYTSDFGMQVLADHPKSIYFTPENGQIYFIRGSSLGSEFGFPRVKQRKWYRWKKMNFTTDLPVHKPIVKYVVATAIKNAWYFPADANQKSYRMHAVALVNKPEYILCHILSLPKHIDEAKQPRIYSVPKTIEPSPPRIDAAGIRILIEAVELLAKKDRQED